MKNLPDDKLAALVAESFDSALVHSIALDSAGNYYGEDQSSKSISDASDNEWLMFLRSKADLIVTSGKTFRAESYRQSRFCPIVVISRTVSQTIDSDTSRFPIFFSTLEDCIDLIKRSGKVLLESGPNLAVELASRGKDIVIALSCPRAISEIEIEMVIADFYSGHLRRNLGQGSLSWFEFGTRQITLIPLIRRA
ncbi:hypothetical protein [Candidatus Rhodoluna planktonica]|uniref:Bacterial bifunctional deaminase-reductase C-terminal domain-containing protein n=1 Tax=Candidatus Rhodoluna planktonica TaxID=535712 RepID=A0A1D9DYY9_9MICO|nr:hypothetical protein [Candidatus Rhodoluna planktonica]AOY56024.1 hypothetical protein A4Z71_03345 [Candidatus Rhodoluna planktonica]